MAARTALILCVDDYENILIGWKMLLEQEGYKVLTATDWRQAFDLFASHEVDEVILDYQMPGMSGDAVAIQMKRIKPDVPILLLSGDRSLSEDKVTSVDAFLFKTDSVTDFLAEVGALLTQCRPQLTPSKPDGAGGTADNATQPSDPPQRAKAA